MTAATYRPALFQPDPADARLLRSCLILALGTWLVLAVTVPWLPGLDADGDRATDVPDAWVTVEFEAEPEPIPEPEPEPIPEPIPEPEPVVEPEPEPVVAEEPEPQPMVAAPAPEPAPEPEPEVAVEDVGLLGLADALGDLRPEAPAPSAPTRAAVRGDGESARVERALLASVDVERSRALAVSARTEVAGGSVRLARETTIVTGVAGGTGGAAWRGEDVSGAADAAEISGARSIESIRRVFDAAKGRIYALYQQARRSRPGLEGKVIFDLVITPAGRVSSIAIDASDLDDPDLLRRLQELVSGLDFGTEPVDATSVRYPVHFFAA